MVNVYRDEPEFVGGPLTASIPENELKSAVDNGWKVKETKTEKPKAEPVEKAEPVKTEEKPLKTTKKKLD